MNHAIALLSVEQSFRDDALPPRGQSRHLALAQFFHANPVGLTTQHPPIHVTNPGAESGAAAVLADVDNVAPLKCGNQLARVFRTQSKELQFELDN
jgi:hypothetical protein